VLASLNALPGFLFGEFAEATIARDWILSQLPKDQPSNVLHGDLLPQNVLCESGENHETAVVDWECAQIGDRRTLIGQIQCSLLTTSSRN
jgi:aminoglycoside phosphotransferase (APT) family kinase protein